MVVNNMKNWEKRELVRNLRRKGFSYSEIIQKFPVSKSSISAWCKDIELTHKQIARLARNQEYGTYIGRLRGAKVNQKKRLREIEKIKILSAKEISPLSDYEFKIAGLMLYWAEGSKKKYVDLSNSDSEIIRFMMRWFRQICHVPNKKFRVQLHLHSGQDESRMKEFWSGITGISKAQFEKSYIKKEGSGHRKNKLYNGTIKIRICDSDLLYRILGWIERFNKMGAASSIR